MSAHRNRDYVDQLRIEALHAHHLLTVRREKRRATWLWVGKATAALLMALVVVLSVSGCATTTRVPPVTEVPIVAVPSTPPPTCGKPERPPLNATPDEQARAIAALVRQLESCNARLSSWANALQGVQQ